jgi:O-methyltransferase
MWARSQSFQKLSGTWAERLGLRIWSRLQFPALKARKEKEIVDLLGQILKEGRSLLTPYEAFFVYSAARSVAHREGAFAEVGVYRGASAKLLCEVKGDKELHLFDTFEGLPPNAPDVDRKIHRVGQYACSIESVQEYLKGYSNVHFHKGIFPESARGVEERTYAFAHFDVDLYEGTVGCLEYFYPRMVRGGILLSHDYDWASGVRKAFDDFFADKPERIIEQPSTQCMLVKE